MILGNKPIDEWSGEEYLEVLQREFPQLYLFFYRLIDNWNEAVRTGYDKTPTIEQEAIYKYMAIDLAKAIMMDLDKDTAYKLGKTLIIF